MTIAKEVFMSIMTAVIVPWIHEYHKIAKMAAIAITVAMLVMVDMTAYH